MRKTVRRASSLCAVRWCAAFATHGDYCSVHTIQPDLHPEYLADDEESVAAHTCEKCKGRKRCDSCRGTGQHSAYCFDCATDHAHDCNKCGGDGNCPTCKGEGVVSYRKVQVNA